VICILLWLLLSVRLCQLQMKCIGDYYKSRAGCVISLAVLIDHKYWNYFKNNYLFYVRFGYGIGMRLSGTLHLLSLSFLTLRVTSLTLYGMPESGRMQ
jgi:hypothetical protein